VGQPAASQRPPPCLLELLAGGGAERAAARSCWGWLLSPLCLAAYQCLKGEGMNSAAFLQEKQGAAESARRCEAASEQAAGWLTGWLAGWLAGCCPPPPPPGSSMQQALSPLGPTSSATRE